VSQRRPCVVAALLAVLLASAHAQGQPATRLPRIGLLFTPSPSVHATLRDALRQGLQELGYVEGRTAVIETRYAEGRVDRLPQLAGELVALKVDVIVTAGSAAINAAEQAAPTTPIVFCGAGDAVAAGHVASLAHPGGNITGLSVLGTELSPKRLQLLKELHPGSTRLAILFNPADAGMLRRVTEAQTAARALGMGVMPLEVRTPVDFDTAFAAMTKERPDALLTVVDAFTLQNRKRIIDFAAVHRIPAVYETREFVDSGGLISYGPSLADNYRRAAAYVDKILKGAKPADLPVEQPTRFELVINRATARTLGLAIPPGLRLRADHFVD
jgi:putative tryptophan/tyrosine transport system substrate-binding protein